ncbi:uncharacterized protein PITG_14701 [Phytophthora infestans T30-4]|uniref:Uncharacterized protein n=1 Tax=Phytophthora infestans (strain T30-4) TaxID=403677 RepID=D0NQW1_PHYIT|nr:uncharacterized protein PITG_14701 [Phytophthora infestans T30-4]EEY63059.1 conserved hypothetical protein [Phytophthora infestans T30-4]|eukprot:XP_002898582.1 conserved hypothetical protein [Phytophthora infestans T30-4]
MMDKAVGAAGSPTSTTSFAAPSMRSRKRVFTFQKRWLHSLPIVERSLPESEMDSRVIKAVRKTGGASAAAAVTAAAAAGADKEKDAIVCMLCDDPASKRELTKVWSRLNCRRGRIENHLMSKHPEFMRLLQHKREAEGDLAVQIFLQNLREGRCSARTEINNGLYSQLTLQKRALGDYIINNVRELREELDGSRKRAKLEESSAAANDVSAMAASAYSAGGTLIRAGVDGLSSSALYQDAAMSAHWQTVFFNKLVVATGGDNKAMASVATQLWLLGANVLLTFR